MLSAWRLVERPQAVDLGGAGPHHGQPGAGVQVAGGPPAADPGVEGDLGHGQVAGQVAQPPFVLGQGRAASGDAGALDACRVQQVADRVGGEGRAAFGWAEPLGVEMAGDLGEGQPGLGQFAGPQGELGVVAELGQAGG